MKLLLAALLCLLTYTSARAQAWPRNPKTGKVEFRGSLPWPASAKTEAQRRALVWRWYVSKLTSDTKEQVKEYVSSQNDSALITYAGLPVVAVVDSDLVPNNITITLFYIVSLKPMTKGLSIQLTRFTFKRATDESTAQGSNLEQLLAADFAGDHAALTTLRNRLAAAIESW